MHSWVRALFAVTLAGCGAPPAPEEAAGRRPNLVLIVADDLGYGHLGCYGQEKIRTPNLDRMAAEGLRFVRAYAGSSVCAPSRSALMTGQHTGHTPVRANGGDRYLHSEDVTMAEVLKPAGYATGLFGKWGLGNRPESPGHPLRQGFDEFFGQLDQMHAHFHYPYWVWDNFERRLLPENEGRRAGRYVHDAIHERALDFIRRRKDRPFFAYLAYTLPHVELAVPEDSEAPYRGRFPRRAVPDPRPGYRGSEDAYATFAGMVGRLDRAVGEVLSLLRELGIADRTFVFFTSDNGAQGGAPWQALVEFFRGTGGLRGAKGQFYEGGLRVPLIAWGPGRVPAGAVTDRTTAFWDVLPTAADLAGVKPPAGIDGVSFAPVLRELPGTRPGCLYWEYPFRDGLAQAALRGNWKAIRPRPEAPLELYDLGEDPFETTDRAAERPGLAKEFLEIFAAARTEERPYPAGVRRAVDDFVR
ncbi:MAG TPA: arylsulfatase [Planctomycetota bacterium]|nr:arylsulfatase [Planctomycetota bacterium]